VIGSPSTVATMRFLTSARAALMPDVLPGDTFVLGSAIGNITFQASQILGFVAGAAVVAVLDPHKTLGIDAVTFAVSAVIVAAGVRSRPVPARLKVLGTEDREFLQSVALKTWRYFETFIGPADHALPPDNVQLVPELTVAHRTSPTNIGMALLATLSAHDFGFIDTDDLVNRIDATLTTVESLERFEGHLMNWYDTRTLAPLTRSRSSRRVA